MKKIIIIENYPRRYPHFFYENLKKSNKISVDICFFGKINTSYAQIDTVAKSMKGDYFFPYSILHIQFWKKFKGSVIIISGFSKISFIIIITVAWLTNVTLINWSEDVFFDKNSRIKKRLWLWYAKLLNTKNFSAFAISENAKKQLISLGVKKSKIKIMPYATNLNSYQLDLGRDQKILDFAKGRKIFLFCGAYCKRKGVDLLIKAFSEIEDSNWILVLVGENIMGSEFQSMLDLSIKEKLIFDRGPVDYREISSVYKSCDVFILPSRYDGWGSVLSEAASIGMPLIASLNCGASKHLIKDGYNGYIVNTSSHKSLKSAMNNYINKNDLIKSHSCRSLNKSKQFNSENSVLRLEKHIMNIL